MKSIMSVEENFVPSLHEFKIVSSSITRYKIHMANFVCMCSERSSQNLAGETRPDGAPVSRYCRVNVV